MTDDNEPSGAAAAMAIVAVMAAASALILAHFLHAVFTVVVLVVFALLNRFRGGGFGADQLIGHPRFYVAPVMLVAALPLLGPLKAAVFAACWLVWCWAPWGYLMCFGHWDPAGRKISALEGALLGLCKGNYSAAFYLRHALFVAPMSLLLLTPWPSIIVPGVALVAYRAGWALQQRGTITNPILVGELATGAAWGLTLLKIAGIALL